MSHGYLADVAYFADSLHQSEFMLSAVLYVNHDGVINDGTYDYDTIGLPFLALLGVARRWQENVMQARRTCKSTARPIQQNNLAHHPWLGTDVAEVAEGVGRHRSRMLAATLIVLASTAVQLDLGNLTLVLLIVSLIIFTPTERDAPPHEPAPSSQPYRQASRET